MEGVKKALQQVHELGFVHCDVSASNVFLNYTHAKPDSISTSSPSSPSLSLSSLSSSSPAPSPPPTTNWNNDENGKMNGRTNELTIIHVVLGDFDAVLKVGERVLHKRAVGKGWPKNVKWGDRVTEEVDWHGYKVLEHWVYKQVGVDVMDEEERNGDGDEGWTTVRAGKW
ncbi:hypothetical protein P280DRAFT_473131 [Massarina eburnea CBS 473.64]|uniref:non-specific serine/threonine protein kinase n=1 Tax=Massarina eburnea CBS 473.64 TaxID=1395130 RepID=A0A6A6RLU8_9PLEO|nr:hypothetical protein P280DRAFT_473131 [Massarina eburnea CBS 473.64]